MVLFKKKQKDINLIDSEATAAGNRIKWVAGVVSLLVIGLFAVTVVVFFFLSLNEGRQAKIISNNLQQRLAEWQGVAKVAENASIVKTKVTQVRDVSTSNKVFIDTLDKVRTLVPAKVRLKSLALGSSNDLELQAISDNPSQIHQFVNKLKEDKFFEKVQVKSLVKSEVDFTLNMTLNVKATK